MRRVGRRVELPSEHCTPSPKGEYCAFHSSSTINRLPVCGWGLDVVSHDVVTESISLTQVSSGYWEKHDEDKKKRK